MRGFILPAPVQGFYNRDQDYYTSYTRAAQTKDGFEDWLYEHVTGVADRRGYLERIGSERDRQGPSARRAGPRSASCPCVRPYGRWGR